MENSNLVAHFVGPPSRFFTLVANCPGMAGTVPEFGTMSRLCPGLPDLVSMSRNTARLHKCGCGSSNSFGPYISIFSGRGGWNLGAGAQIVGVAAQNGRGQIFSRVNTLSWDLFLQTWQL